MFSGEYNHTIDEKGRIIIPNKFRDLLGDVFVVTKGFEGCLTIYTNDKWNELENKLNMLPLTDERARTLKRFLQGGCIQLELDKQGRVLITQPLRKYANLKSSITFVGLGDHIELWDSELWNKNCDFSDYEKLGKSMEGLGI